MISLDPGIQKCGVTVCLNMGDFLKIWATYIMRKLMNDFGLRLPHSFHTNPCEPRMNKTSLY